MRWKALLLGIVVLIPIWLVSLTVYRIHLNNVHSVQRIYEEIIEPYKARSSSSPLLIMDESLAVEQSIRSDLQRALVLDPDLIGKAMWANVHSVSLRQFIREAPGIRLVNQGELDELRSHCPALTIAPPLRSNVPRSDPISSTVVRFTHPVISDDGARAVVLARWRWGVCDFAGYMAELFFFERTTFQWEIRRRELLVIT